MIDSHIHLSRIQYQGEFPYLTFKEDKYSIERGTLDELIQQFITAGIYACIEPGIEINTNEMILALADKYKGFLFPAVGVHPTRTFRFLSYDDHGVSSVQRLTWEQRSILEKCAASPEVVAIGETGLDYHLELTEQHRTHQKMWFIYQLILAHRLKLPVILHIRDADDDALEILQRYRELLHGGVCHCFTGSAETAHRYTDLDLRLGIGGALLIDSPNQRELEQAVALTPLEYLFLETDSPYVKPTCSDFTKRQLQKARNTSLILPAVAKRIAELKNISAAEVMRITAENTVRLFRLQNRLKYPVR